ncbi:MAG: 5-oxoprolinase/urea amidolyase family protein [Thermoleophilia bacterium]
MGEARLPRRVLVANRGEIACRIMRTLRAMGIGAVAVHSEADVGAPHVRMADAAVRLGPAAAAESYLRADRVLDAALSAGAEAVHPGYGFLSEDPSFAAAVEEAGLAFCGPTPGQIADFGRKDTARALARAEGLALLPGSDRLADERHALAEAARVGYPVMLKSAAGGGGIGMALCEGPDALREAFGRVERASLAAFGSADLLLERYVPRARHVEVQVFGDGEGAVAALGDRDCSMQRRHQKVLEEAPAPGLPDALRARLADDAVRLCASVAYRSAGTVEFLVDADGGEAWFLEVNTRLQVEHGVTEEVLGIDLVEWMVRQAGGQDVLAGWSPRPPAGHAIEARIYAEDPVRGHRPAAGVLIRVALPEGVRVDGWVEPGTEVTPHYDPLLAKVVAHGPDRDAALRRLGEALRATDLHGLETNVVLLRAAVASGPFAEGRPTTGALAAVRCPADSAEVLEPGLVTTVQAHPGRLGLWHVGVPPSGPMDDRSFRLANRLVGNPEGAPALEMTRTGPTLRFDRAARVCLGGARMAATLDGRPVPWWRGVAVAAGQVLRIGAVEGPGARAYLAVAGGLDVPEYLGSAATFTLGGFGGHGGRALRAGDVLRLLPDHGDPPAAAGDLPVIAGEWELGVRYGPHAAPDFFTEEYLERLLGARWSVHHNSDRTGVRLLGPAPGWAREDGGDAGLHPSNIHDCPYAVGAVDFTGDMPVILGPDGPSLGGFVCPVTVAEREMWKLGQLSPGDGVRFRLLDRPAAGRRLPDAVLARREERPGGPAVVYRRSGDDSLLVEYGPPVLDLALRLRAHALMGWVAARGLPGVIDLTPGIRSLQVHLDPGRLAPGRALDLLMGAEDELAPVDEAVVPSREVRLPLAWEDPSVLLAVERYTSSVRPDAPWCPSNVEFIRRINGLDDVEEVRRILYEASYLVLGLGDVYLGAPVATPVDPRHRLVTTKYNPARTWTPENAVGIGGAYMCVYGMEGPGGYQLVGRTVPVWNTHRTTRDFPEGAPWLLRFFDRIRFFPVTARELEDWRRGVRDGTRALDIADGEFSLRAHREFLAGIAPDVEAFRARREAAFRRERERWEADGAPAAAPAPPPATREAAPAGQPVAAQLAANVWKVRVAEGDLVAEGEVVAVLEAMKMEVAVSAPRGGRVARVLCAPGDLVLPGQALLTLAEEGTT